MLTELKGKRLRGGRQTNKGSRETERERQRDRETKRD